LQQVGAKGFANAQPVDPRQFPIPLAKPAHRRMLVTAGSIWVLHRKQIVRVWGVLLALVAMFGLYQARDLLATGRPSARQAVLTYLDGLTRFWKMDNGAIRVWRSDIEAGREPNFGAHLLY